MMRLIFGTFVLSVVFMGAALADPQANLYNNTIVVTSAAGVGKSLINADHTYSATSPDGKIEKGKWEIKGDEVCYERTDPPSATDEKATCVKSVERKVGETWDAVGADGKPIKVTLQAGR